MEAQNTQKNTHGVATGYKVFYLQTFGIFVLFATFLFAIDFVPELTIRAEGDPEATITVSSPVEDTLVVNNEVVETVSTVGAVVLATDGASDSTATTVAGNVVYSSETELPVRIVATDVGIDTVVLAPEEADIASLDTALLSGAVYYPGSGMLGQNANVLIFGHSSHLPVVYNKAYKAFNELNKLSVGDTIDVYSATHRYVYSVNEVFLSDAGDAEVSFDASEPSLTLVTCNNFGAKEERWVVIATLVSKYAL